MKLFKRQNANASAPGGEAAAPAKSAPTPGFAVRKLLLSVLIIVLVILAGNWAIGGNSNSHNDKKVINAGGSSQSSKPSQPTASKPAAAPPAATPGTLSNTGPGDVVALFAIAFIAGTGLHYLIVWRRLAAENL